METMKNTERTGVDIRVALSSRAKAISAQAHHLQAGSAAQAGTGAGGQGFRARIKRWIKPFARGVYKIFRPVGSPLAFRTRAYLMAPLVTEIHQIRQQIAKDLAAHKRAQQEATERLLSAHTMSVKRELKASQDALRSRLATRATSALIQNLLQPAGTFAEFGAHAEVQGAIAVLKIDAARFEPGMLDEIASIVSRNPHMALIVAFDASHHPNARHSNPDWPRVFAHLGLVAKAIDPESGVLQDASMHSADDALPHNLFLAREGANAWRRAQGAL
ncbi:hypothetical protein SRS16CHR_00747 [Variovorax sp. SRS16]|nr:hypothetical protein SRS16CHR_00747 [Variovorax sp. SRS16]